MRRLLILLRFEWVDLKLSFKNKNSIYLTKVDRLADDVYYKKKMKRNKRIIQRKRWPSPLHNLSRLNKLQIGEGFDFKLS
jgi:hypothetical protein